ncbi:uncharacterized protein G2W53_027133 [Senna tora]|uniref:Uncharacterized protein n=1 Tax=Senna tora TaxID=362788 RepID=A0A834TGJ9_9FABA|nr:uncharacterized protein G2W53_027133 [Senna tora]
MPVKFYGKIRSLGIKQNLCSNREKDIISWGGVKSEISSLRGATSQACQAPPSPHDPCLPTSHAGGPLEGGLGTWHLGGRQPPMVTADNHRQPLRTTAVFWRSIKTPPQI